MKKFLALLLAVMMFGSLVACGGEATSESESAADASVEVVETAMTEEQQKALTEVYNQVATLYNDVYLAAEKNGWLNDELTVTELNAVAATMGTVGTALTEDASVLEGVDVDALIATLSQLAPAMEQMAQKVAVAYVAG